MTPDQDTAYLQRNHEYKERMKNPDEVVVMYNLGVKLMYQFLSMQHNYSRHYKYRRYWST